MQRDPRIAERIKDVVEKRIGKRIGAASVRREIEEKSGETG
jgi:hypothetical protein